MATDNGLGGCCSFLIHRRDGYVDILGAILIGTLLRVSFLSEVLFLVGATVLTVDGVVALDLQFWLRPCW